MENFHNLCDAFAIKKRHNYLKSATTKIGYDCVSSLKVECFESHISIVVRHPCMRNILVTTRKRMGD